MIIFFICGSLEPGHDGVGDYTHRLSECLVKLGNYVVCIAINDIHVTADCCYSKTFSAQTRGEIHTLRFSSRSSWKSRFQILRRFIFSQEPDFISLQYVSYSFSTNGLAIRFTTRLRELRGSWQWHIMFHELWIGRDSTFKNFLISLAQQSLIKLTTHLLQPKVIHTSIEHYQDELSKIDINSLLLPLHSNIPYIHSNNKLDREHSQWTFLFFGSLDSQWQPQPFFDHVEEGRILGNKQSCLFVCLGRKREAGKRLWDLWTSADIQKQYPAFFFQEVGVSSVQEISLWLQSATFGISMAPLQWIGKSGSVAAMIEHGLPVIVPSYQPRAFCHRIPNETKTNHFLFINSSLPKSLCAASRHPIKNMDYQSAISLLTGFKLILDIPKG